MSRRTDLDDVVSGLIFPTTKTASAGSAPEMSLFDLRALAELREQEKAAGNGDPLREKMKRLGQLKKKHAEEVEYSGQINNGIPQNPEWPRAALGVDSANRKATPEERRIQESYRTPDVQHVAPRTDGEHFVNKGAHDEKLLSLFSGNLSKIARTLERHSDVDTLTKNMKPGDVVLMTPQPLPEDANLLQRIGGSVFGAVSGAIQGKYTHSGIYVGNGNVIDIRAETGVRKIPLKDVTKDLGVAVVRPRIGHKARREAVQKAEGYLKNRDKIHYNMKDLIPAAASSFMDLGDKPINENQVICSSMVANAFGKHRIIPGVSRHATKPSDFLDTPRVNYVGKYDPPAKVAGKMQPIADLLGPEFAAKARAAAVEAGKHVTPIKPRTDRTVFARVSDILKKEGAAPVPSVLTASRKALTVQALHPQQISREVSKQVAQDLAKNPANPLSGMAEAGQRLRGGAGINPQIPPPPVHLFKASALKIAFKPGQVLTGTMGAAHNFGDIAQAVRKFEGGAAQAAKRVPPPIPASAASRSRQAMQTIREAAGPYSARNQQIAEQLRSASPSAREYLARQIVI